MVRLPVNYQRVLYWFRIRILPVFTHSDTDFGLEVDQFPSESLRQRCDGVFCCKVHT
jgi:hypothetical protein